MYSAHSREVITPHLRGGERLLWTGRPDPGKWFSRADFFLIPFSIMWGGFAIFWEVSVLAEGAGVFFALWGVPFVLVGLYFMFGRFIYKARQKRKTFYAITDQRALAVSGSNGTRVEAVFLRNVPSVNQSIGRGGTGSIIFGNTSPMLGMYMNSGMDVFARQYGQPAVAFFDVPNAQEALAVANEQVRAAR